MCPISPRIISRPSSTAFGEPGIQNITFPLTVPPEALERMEEVPTS
jgi:hypothetical protein